MLVVRRLLCRLLRLFHADPQFLERPLAAATNHLIYTALPEIFFTQVKIAMFGGACLGFPVIAAQLWMFVAPGLYKHEQRAFLPFLCWTPVLFMLGAAFVYYVMLPFSIKFFGGYQVRPPSGAMGIQLQAKVSDYLDLVMTLMFAFGLTFQLPVLLSLLGKVGIVTPRRCGTCAATPLSACSRWRRCSPRRTPISMMSLAVPLVRALRNFDLLRGDDRAGQGARGCRAQRHRGRSIERFQEKCGAVFRPEPRQTKS